MADENPGRRADDRWAPQQCIPATRISETEVVNDRAILFYMNGGDVYLNRLPGRCPGLTKSSGFSYFPITANRLCRLDFIGLRRFTGGDFSPATNTGCGLGLFRPIPEALAIRIKEWQRARNDDAPK